MARIGIGWEVGVPSGWGIYGLNLALELARHGIEPAILFRAEHLALTARQQQELAAPLADHPKWRQAMSSGGFDFPLLQALGDQLELPPQLRGLKGRPTFGVAFCESATVPARNLTVVRDFAAVITGSSWNAEVLARHGITVRNCPQGVDLDLFAPGPRSDRFAGRFAVFSGGKLEYRKSQDLVIAAFKRFHARHPDALLVAAWHNPWPAAAAELTKSPHVKGNPVDAQGQLKVGRWLSDNGLPEDSFLDVGALANAETPGLLREVDVAVFPSRCEGGTNLVAMEAMACGVPVILSRNTGHLDLIAGDNCYSLDFQIPMGEVTGRADLVGWGESSIDEILARLEDAYTNREAARVRGLAGAAFLKQWGWPAQIGRLLEAIAEFC